MGALLFREVRLSPEVNGPTLLNTCKCMYLFFSKIFDSVIAKSDLGSRGRKKNK